MARIVRMAKPQMARRMLQAEENRAKVDELNRILREQNQEIEDLMLERGVDEYIVDDDEDKVLSALVFKKDGKITYDLNKMQEAIPKSKLKVVTDSMLVADEVGLSRFIKNHPELRDELKDFVKKVTVINERKLATAIECEVISIDEIADCYTQGKDTTVFKLQRKKREE